MVERRESEPKVRRTRPRPATTPEDRESQLIELAVDLAEQQIVDGTASAQVITHYLKLGSTREKLEQRRIALENELVQAKTEQIASQKKSEELFVEAIKAMKSYSPMQDSVEMEEGFEAYS